MLRLQGVAVVKISEIKGQMHDYLREELLIV